MAKRWIQKMHMKKGALHSNLGIPQGQKIPESRLRSAAKKKGKVGAEARLAERFRKFRGSHGVGGGTGRGSYDVTKLSDQALNRALARHTQKGRSKVQQG